jgi:large subunit ribosomal protein L22
MTATKTNERPGTRAQVRYVRTSAYKAREVLDLVRGLPVAQAADVLRFTERGAAQPISKLLASAVANAEHNDEQDASELFVSACYADEGPTLKRWRPRARGRATRIRKRTCHITIIVSRMSPDQLERHRAKLEAAATGTPAGRTDASASRRARVARSRGEDIDETASDEIAGEPTEDTVDAVTDAAEQDTGTDEAAAGEIAGEPTEDTVDAVTDAAADEAADNETAENETAENETADTEVGEPTEEMVEDAEEAADTEPEEKK